LRKTWCTLWGNFTRDAAGEHHQLSKLDHRLLDDIGISPTQVEEMDETTICKEKEEVLNLKYVHR